MLTLAGAIAGIGAAAAFLFIARVKADTEGNRLGVSVVALPAGEFSVAPKKVINDAELEPAGRAATGTLRIRNQTGRSLTASLRAEASVPDVGRTVHIKATTKRGTVFDGDLQDLKQWRQIPGAIDPGKEQTVHLSARLSGPGRPLHGLSQDVTISIEVGRNPTGES